LTAKKKRAASSANTASWLVTFSDLATLMLTFFVLLLSMSSMDDLRLKTSFHNFTSTSGVLLFKDYGEIYRPKEILIEGLNQKLEDALVVRKKEEITDQSIPSDIVENPFKRVSGNVVFEEFKGGFKLVFGQDLLFNSGSAKIKENMGPILGQIAKFIQISPYQIYIDGHTDNVPIHTDTFPSNRSLSLARAYNIMDYLVGKEGVPSHNIALAGYGESKPIATNDTAKGKEQNRRVEMIFKNQKYF
jgi:chemotaxis protein MotB